MWTMLVLFLAHVVSARDFDDSDHYRLPRLYHLDNYDRCLSRPHGLYCTGTFRVSANKHNAVYTFMKEYSSNEHHFDRTLVHRGYCLSARCPSDEPNVTLRFEQCVEKHAIPGLRASILPKTYYCKSAQDLRQAHSMDVPQMAFLVVVGLLILMNVVGSIYDVFTGGGGKSKWLSAWSVQQNVKRLFFVHSLDDQEQASLAPLGGVRVLLLALVVMTHASEILHKVYLYNPEFFEQVPRYGASILVRNGSSLVQTFFVLSSYLLARCTLRLPWDISIRHLPICLLNRAARLAPLHLLCVGFAATWWSVSGDGPQWGAVADEAALCRRRFWLHAIFAHNAGDEQCLLPAWFLAVDMQLYALAAALTLWLRTRRFALVVLSALLLAAVGLNAALAHFFEWTSMLYIITPENVRTTFKGESSFVGYYTAPWGSLPAALVGLIAAFLHDRLHSTGVQLTDYKWFVLISRASPALVLAWLMSGRVTPRAALPVLERPTTALLSALVLLALVSGVDSYFRRMAAWHGWTVLSRASLSVLLVHWLVNLRLVAVRRTLSEVSIFTIGSDLLSTLAWTHIVALPLTVLVEIPMRRTALALLL